MLAGAAAGVVLGAWTGLLASGPTTTAAVLTDQAMVSAEVTVAVCTPTFGDLVTTLLPARWWTFAPDGVPAGSTASPGLLGCDPTTGALALTGGLAEGWTDPADALPAPADTLTLALLVDVTGDPTTSGELASVHRVNGEALRLRLQAGVVELLQVPPELSGGPTVLIASAALAAGGPHLVAVTRIDGVATLLVDGTPVGAGTIVAAPSSAVAVTVGARSGTGLQAAHALVDELLLLDHALDPATLTALHSAATS